MLSTMAAAVEADNAKSDQAATGKGGASKKRRFRNSGGGAQCDASSGNRGKGTDKSISTNRAGNSANNRGNKSKKMKTKTKKVGAGDVGLVKRSVRQRTAQTSAEAELKKKLALHNKSLIAKKRKVKYEPRKHSIKDVRAWEQRHKRMWVELTVEERVTANEEISAMRAANAN